MKADGGSDAELIEVDVGKVEEEGARREGFVGPFEVLIEGAGGIVEESESVGLISSAEAVVVAVGFDNPPSPARLIIPGTLPPFVVTGGSVGAEAEGAEEEEALVTGGI